MKKINRKFCVLLTAILAVSMLLMTSCSGSSDTENDKSATTTSGADTTDASSTSDDTAESGVTEIKSSNSDGDTWTILLYLCGTDLESEYGSATLNLEEIVSAGISDNVNVVIEAGGAYEWYNDTIDPDILGRYLVTDSDLELVEAEDLADMSDAGTYTDFLTWGVENYPADKYMTIVWDHGGGSVSGVVIDELFYDGSNRSLSVKDVASGIQATGQQFEVVGFDACLMSTLEQAAAIAPYAKYMVASEETEPGTGWDYTYLLSSLYLDPTETGAELGKQIVDSFYDKCDEGGEADACTLAVTDLSKIPKLVEDFNEMASQMKGCTEDISQIKTITGAFKTAQNYGGNNDDEGYTDMVDLGDLALNAEDVLDETAENVIDDLLDAVIYHKDGSARSKSEGLSVYVPLSGSEENFDTYAANAAISGDYLRFLEELYGFEVPENINITIPTTSDNGTVTTENTSEEDYAPAETIENKDQSIEYNAEINEDGYYQVNVTNGSDIIDGARCNVYWHNTDDDLYYYLGSDYNVTINDDWDTFTDNFDNTWIYINGHLCEINPISINDEVIEYYVPVYVNDERSNLRLIWNFDTDAFEVLGLWDGIEENGMPSRNFRELEDGDVVDFVFKVQESLDSEAEELTFEGFTVDGDITVSEEDMGDGEYAYSMDLDDIFGNTTETSWATIYVYDNEISAEMAE